MYVMEQMVNNIIYSTYMLPKRDVKLDKQK